MQTVRPLRLLSTSRSALAVLAAACWSGIAVADPAPVPAPEPAAPPPVTAPEQPVAPQAAPAPAEIPPPASIPAERKTPPEAPVPAPVSPPPAPTVAPVPVAEIPVAAPAERTGTTPDASPLVAPATPATAVPAGSTTGIAATAEPAAKPSNWAGTSVTYRNLVSVPTLARGYEQTWNPNYANALMIVPQYALTDRIYLRGWQYTTFELTNADDTTSNHEVQWSDTILTLGAKLVKDKATGITVSLGGNFVIPTSKASQARTMNFGVGLGGGVAWSRGPVSISYSGRATVNSFRSMYGENASSWVPNCSGLVEGCDPYLSTGRRNAQFGFMNITSLGWEPTKWLGFSAGAGLIHSLLFPLKSATIEVNGNPVTIDPSSNNTDLRVLMYWALGAEIHVHEGISIGAGAETYNPQLASDSKYETPFVNRYTTLYLDLQVSPDKLLSSLR